MKQATCENREVLSAQMSEADLQSAIIGLARLLRWHVHHARPARTESGGWATHIQGDAGFPDLVLAKAGRVLIVELKSTKGTLDPKQRAWLDALGTNAGLVATVWRPKDWSDGTIERTLRAA